ncbi:MAG TPA: type VI secretion system contractile sheath large subunit [Bryobacteraceae bacterium]|nr:type VI secretion system contractile sheath large subunit [Bryobacteraceae bacterium]
MAKKPAGTSTRDTSPNATEVLEPSLLDQIVEEGRIGRDPAARERGKDMVAEFVNQILDGQMTVSPDLEAMIQQRIGQIDHLLSLQLNAILHHPTFQKLEATWRGIRYLLEHSETGVNLKLKLFNGTKKDILRDLQRVPEFDQSQMFKKVYEHEFGVFGGEPFACLLGDYEFGRGPEDIEFLERISQVAAAAHAPFLSAASPELMNLESFTQLDAPRDLAKAFDTTEYARWKGFRMSEDSRYVCLSLPHVLMRVPYGKDTKPVDAFRYEEGVTGHDHSQYLWGNAAYALGARITNAFSLYGWCAAIRGVEGGGLVDGLPSHVFQTEHGDVALKCPTETIITDRREKELADLGFAPLVHCKGTDYAAFFSVQTCQKPKSYDTEQANANARLSAQLPYMLAVCRFAHYLKSMMRDKVGSFTSRKDCEIFLNNWIVNYVNEDDTASHAVKAQFPLREARIEVIEDKSKPGVFKAIAFLRPHFQLEELSVSLRLVAELPRSAR